MLDWIEKLTSLPATIISGVCLVITFMFPDLPLSPAWVAVAISGLPLVVSAVRKLLFNKGLRRISSALLISVAMVAAAAIGDVFAAGEVAFLMAVGELLEDATTARARRGLGRLLSLTPKMGRLVTADGEEMIDTAAIRVGHCLRVLPGETVPVDGVVIAGESAVDQTAVTGESLPVDKTPGDSVYSGTINRFGAMVIEATRVGEDSSIQRLVKLVQQADEQKAPTHRAADRWASILVPMAMLVAILAGIIKQDIVTAVTVLVVFCPCALVLATPTAIMAAIGQATKRGVIIKSGAALEAMAAVDTVALDKTGTITTARLSVTEVATFDEQVPLLPLVAAAERDSEHPLGRAIVAYAAEQGVPPLSVTDFRMTAGRGVYARVDGKAVHAGSEGYLAQQGVSLTPVQQETVARLQAQGKATVSVAADGVCIGIVALADTLKPSAATAVASLQEGGIHTVLLTGDSRQAAAYFAHMVGIREVKSQLLPQQKVETVAALQQEGHRVCMVGDGINDAPALKAASVSVAMGAIGSDIAVEAADIALMGDDMAGLPYLKKLAKTTVATIRTGIALSLVINFAAIALSLLGWLNPTTGALVHNAGSVLVVLLAAGLYDRKIK